MTFTPKLNCICKPIGCVVLYAAALLDLLSDDYGYSGKQHGSDVVGRCISHRASIQRVLDVQTCIWCVT